MIATTATAIEFRLRYVIFLVLWVLGFTSPWDRLLHLDSIRTWQFLAAWPARSGWMSFSAATLAVLILGILCAFLAAALRTWAAAYLGAFLTHDSAMHGDRIVSAGPYRYLRNPLYLGAFLHTVALALLMPPSGAIFCILAIGLFEGHLIADEERSLTAKLGESYLVYCAKVPRILPSVARRIAASTLRPHWPAAFLGEIYFWGAGLSFAALGWRYNSVLIIQGVIISLGVSFIARAFLPKS